MLKLGEEHKEEINFFLSRFSVKFVLDKRSFVKYKLL